MQLPPEAADSLAEDELAALGIEELLRLGSPTRVEAGPGAVARLGECARELGGKRLFVVTDTGLRQAGHEGRVRKFLRDSGFTDDNVAVFDDVTSNPTTEDVDRALAVAQSHQADLIIGLGGGSSMDCAKGVNFLLTNGGCIEDYWGVGKAANPMLPMIAVPTTAGTGSEAQSFALIADAITHMKMACGDKKAACRVAILDPELTLTMPSAVTAATGIDAISHALETAVTTRRNPISGRFSLEAWSRLASGFPRVVDNPADIEARQAMLYGAHLAGAAIENSMLGATHALANPLSAHYGMTHGVAIGLMLPHVIRFNQDVVGEIYLELLDAVGMAEVDGQGPGETLARTVERMREAAGLPSTLAECDIRDDLLDELANEAAEQWTGNFNPKPVTATTLRDLYICASPRSSS
ncbi:MAG: iron-containing alcohol dehydrogenase [Planctomycetota bacterium]|nr:iron-containing alcohol dehydrogenase [Planctomycetota bacterium]MED5400128.1 iron-containing alcohol dehydrogenase [Planctomycetota bacterium]